MDQGGLFSYVSIEERVPRRIVAAECGRCLDEALDSMSRDFDSVYAEGGRESVAPERLVRALVLQVLYSIAPNDCCVSNSTTTCCSAGSWSVDG